jgi:hypothetical protein
MVKEQFLNMVLDRFRVATNYHEAIKLLNDKCKMEQDQRKIIAFTLAIELMRSQIKELMGLGIKEYEYYLTLD